MPKLEYRRTVVDLNDALVPTQATDVASDSSSKSRVRSDIEGPIMAKILVVEDFPPIATLLVTLLRRRGHQISREQTMAGALRLKGFFDHAVLDIDLPDGNGVTRNLPKKTMRQLVEGCNEVPGGTAQFTATLLVDGRIELATVDGGLGTVPICVLHHELKHKFIVKKPCTMQVQMSERKPSAGAPPDTGRGN